MPFVDVKMPAAPPLTAPPAATLLPLAVMACEPLTGSGGPAVKAWGPFTGWGGPAVTACEPLIGSGAVG